MDLEEVRRALIGRDEEVVQEVLLRVWQRLPNNPVHWARRVAKRLTLNKIRAETRRDEYEEKFGQAPQPLVASPLDRMIAIEEFEAGPTRSPMRVVLSFGDVDLTLWA